MHCCNNRACHAACCVAWAVMHTILKVAEGAVAKVKQHANSVALLVAACPIVVFLAVAVEASIVEASMNQPSVYSLP